MKLLRMLKNTKICYNVTSYVRQWWWRIIDRIVKFLYKNAEFLLLIFILLVFVIGSHVAYVALGYFEVLR